MTQAPHPTRVMIHLAQATPPSQEVDVLEMPIVGLWIVILVSSCIVYHDGVRVHFVEGGAHNVFKRDLHLHQNGSRDMTIKDH